MSRIYADSRTVAVATIQTVDTSRRLLRAQVTNTLKGTMPDALICVQISAPADMIAHVTADQPMVVFVGGTEAQPVGVFHLCDTWLLGNTIPNMKPQAWRITQPYDGARSFPGRTAALARFVEGVRAGKPPVADVLDPCSLRGIVGGPVALTATTPGFIANIDMDGDGNEYLLVSASGKFRLFLTRDGACSDITDTWGLSDATGARAATGDITGDGKADLLLGSRLWVRKDNRYVAVDTTPALPPEADRLAATLTDVSADGLAELIVLLKTGELRTYTNPGEESDTWTESATRLWKDSREPMTAAFSPDWGDDGKLHVLVVFDKGIVRYAATGDDPSPADFQRLTGRPVASVLGLAPLPIKPLVAMPLDADGNGRMDFLIVTAKGGATLVNRGLGTFLVDEMTHARFHSTGEDKLPFALTADCAVAPGKMRGRLHRGQDLLVLTPDGRLFEIRSRYK